MKKTLFALLLILCVHGLSVAQDMRTLFVEAPDSVFPLLDKNLRADCVDFIDAGMKYAVTNKLEGKSTLVELAADYMLLETTASSTIQMKKLPMADGFIICVVNTVCAESADSRVAFFDSSWRRLAVSDFLASPSIRDFFASDSVADELMDMCDIYLVSLSLNADDKNLVAEYTMPSYMNKDEAEKVLPHLQKIIYNWDGMRFIRK